MISLLSKVSDDLMDDEGLSSRNITAASVPPDALPDPVLYFAPDAYSIDMPNLMGRNVAGESFLRGLIRHGGLSALRAQIDVSAHAGAFTDKTAQLGWKGPVRIIDRTSIGRLAETGVLIHPAPNIDLHARRRCLFGPSAWSICGVTHTTASARVMDAVTGLITGATREWDALVCTSVAVRANVVSLLEAECERLAKRFGHRPPVLPQLPIIPLGIDTEDFAFEDEEHPRARRELGIEDGDVVVLFVGRLSFHAKANPVSLYAALEAAARRTGTPVKLVEAGWFATPSIREAFEASAARLCPSVPVIRVDAREAAAKRRVWAAADIFCSLSDNIQETFGLTPIEAMSAGLPVVVSDWDGYRETVRHGIDGFRIPTIAPMPGLGYDLAFRHAIGLDDYEHYSAATSSLVAVDIDAAAAAFERLLTSPEMRRRMGAAGRERARAIYDWAAVVPLHRGLWADLARRRRDAPRVPEPWPARPDPFRAFAAHPSALLGPATIVSASLWDGETAEEALNRCLCLPVMAHSARFLPPTGDMVSLLRTLERDGPMPVERGIERAGLQPTPVLVRSLTFLAKVGLIAWRHEAGQ